MFDFLLNIMNQSEAIVLAETLGERQTTVGDDAFVRHDMKVREALRGSLRAGDAWTLDIRFANKETPQLASGQEYAFFVVQDAPRQRWTLVNLSRPLRVPTDERDAYLRCLRDWLALTGPKPAEAALKAQILRALQGRLPFFVSDAARMASTIQAWDESELKTLIDVVDGDAKQPPLTGNDRDHLIAVFVAHAKPEPVTAFARKRLKAGETDPIYFGLGKRSDPAVVVDALLRDADEDIQVGGLRLAGLLRRADAIDGFERSRPGGLSPRLKEAVSDARKLVGRD